MNDVYIQKSIISALILDGVHKLEHIQGIQLGDAEVEISGDADGGATPERNPPTVQVITPSIKDSYVRIIIDTDGIAG